MVCLNTIEYFIWNVISSNLYHLIPILLKVACYANTKSLKFWPTQTKMSYWTKDRNLFVNAVMTISIDYLTIKPMINITFNTIQ